MKQSLLLLCSFFMAVAVFGQNLKIENNERKAYIKQGTYLSMKFRDKRLSTRTDCACMQVNGALRSQTKDSISIKADWFFAFFDKPKEELLTSQIDFSQTNLVQQYAKKDLMFVRTYKSLKQKKRKGGFGAIGGLLITTGLVTTLHYFAVPNKRSKKNLLISGSSQLVVGITLGFLSGTKKYNFDASKVENPWRFVDQ